jgi:hypothetical protein
MVVNLDDPIDQAHIGALPPVAGIPVVDVLPGSVYRPYAGLLYPVSPTTPHPVPQRRNQKTFVDLMTFSVDTMVVAKQIVKNKHNKSNNGKTTASKEIINLFHFLELYVRTGSLAFLGLRARVRREGMPAPLPLAGEPGEPAGGEPGEPAVEPDEESDEEPDAAAPPPPAPGEEVPELLDLWEAPLFTAEEWEEVMAAARGGTPVSAELQKKLVAKDAAMVEVDACVSEWDGTFLRTVDADGDRNDTTTQPALRIGLFTHYQHGSMVLCTRAQNSGHGAQTPIEYMDAWSAAPGPGQDHCRALQLQTVAGSALYGITPMPQVGDDHRAPNAGLP